MTDAEKAVQKAAASIPADVRKRFESVDKLSDEDRKAIIEIAHQVLIPFRAKPDPNIHADPKSESEPAAGSESKPAPPKPPKEKAKTP
jgi:F-type H+-transporting ATPase subunit alpha